MTPAEVARLLGLAREADLVGPDTAGWVARLTPERERLVEAGRPLTVLVAGLLRIPEGFFGVCAWCGREQPES